MLKAWYLLVHVRSFLSLQVMLQVILDKNPAIKTVVNKVN